MVASMKKELKNILELIKNSEKSGLIKELNLSNLSLSDKDIEALINNLNSYYNHKRKKLEASEKIIQKAFFDFLQNPLKVQSIDLKNNKISHISSLNFFLKICDLKILSKVDFSGNELQLRGGEYPELQLFLRNVLKSKIKVLPFRKNHIAKSSALLFMSVFDENAMRAWPQADMAFELESIDFSENGFNADDLQGKMKEAFSLIKKFREGFWSLENSPQLDDFFDLQPEPLNEENKIISPQNYPIHADSPTSQTSFALLAKKKASPGFVKYAFRQGTLDFFCVIWPFSVISFMLNDGLHYFQFPNRQYGMLPPQLLTGFYRKAWGLLGGEYDGFPNQPTFWFLPGAAALVFFLLVAVEARTQQQFLHHLTPMKEFFHTLEQAIQDKKTRILWSEIVFPWSTLRKALEDLEISAKKNTLSKDDFLLVSPLRTLAEKAPFPLKKQACMALSLLASPIPETLSLLSPPETFLAEDKARAALQTICNAGGMGSVFARYYLWKIHEPTSLLKRIAYRSLQISGQGFKFVIGLYGVYRLGQLLLLRVYQAFTFFRAQHHCHEENQVWSYSSASGEYECTVCGDWPFVPTQNVQDPQACLDGLLRLTSISSWEERLSHLAHFAGNFTRLDASHAPFATWNETEASKIFQALSPLSQSWEVVNFSSPTLNAIWSSNRLLDELADFLNAHPTQSFDLSNQNLGNTHWQRFLRRLHPESAPNDIRITNNNIGDDGLLAYIQWSNGTLSNPHIDVSGNRLTDAVISSLLAALPPNTTQFLDLSNNLWTGAMLSELAHYLPHSQLCSLRLNNNDLTGGNYTRFGAAIQNTPSLRSIDVENIQLDDFSLVNLSTNWKNQTLSLQRFNAAHNRLTGQGIRVFSQQGGGQFLAVNWAGNRIDDEGLLQIQGLLFSVQWQQLNLSQIPAHPEAFQDIWSFIANSTIRRFALTSMNLGDHVFSPLLKLLKNGTITLEELDISRNHLTDAMAGELLNQACQRNVSRMSFNQNNLSQVFASAANWPLKNFSCRFLSFQGDPFDHSLSQLFSLLPAMQYLEEIQLDGSQIDEPAFIQLAQTLIAPLPNPRDLEAENMPYDEARALNQSGPNTPLRKFSARGTSITLKARRALMRVKEHLPDLDIQLSPMDPPPWDEPYTANAERLQPFASFTFFKPENSGLSRPHTFLNSSAFNMDRTMGLVLATLPILHTLLLLWVLYRLLSPLFSKKHEQPELLKRSLP